MSGKFLCAGVAIVLLAVFGGNAAAEATCVSEWDKTGDFGDADSVVSEPGRLELVWQKPDRRPIWFGAKSSSVEAGLDGDYCVYLDILYADGEWKWRVTADFPRGSHASVVSESVFHPEKPVSKILYHAFLRRTTGQAKFDGAFLRRRLPEEGRVMSERRFTARPFQSGDRAERKVLRGGRQVTEAVLVPAERPANVPIAEGRTVVWTADSMRRVSPLAFPTDAEAAAPRISLELARGEAEAAQVCVSCGPGAGGGEAAVEIGSLTRADGLAFAGSATCERIGYLARRNGYAPHPCGAPEDELWFPEPLLPGQALRTVPDGTVGAWLTFKAARDAQPGVYAGSVWVTVGGRRTAIPCTVRVRDFALPERFGLKTAYSVMDGFTRAAYPDDFAAKKRESWDLMLDHRLNPDDISRTTPPDLDDLAYAAKRGMNSFNVLNLVPPAKPNQKWVCWANPEAVFSESCYEHFRKTLTPYVAELKRRGLDHMAYLYGFDERGTNYYGRLLPLWQRLKADFGLPVMTTAYMFMDVVKGKLDERSPFATMTDIHVPIENIYSVDLADRYRAAGKKVWWYTCCGPTHPNCNNASYEYPLIECRMLGWLQYRTRADGYLFWHVNFWNDGAKLDERETFFPDWNTYSSLKMPGDGVFLYPGKSRILPGIRLANVRDGVEDYEWLQLAEAKAGRAAVDRVLAEVARTVKDFTRDPSVVRLARSRLGDLVEGGSRTLWNVQALDAAPRTYPVTVPCSNNYGRVEGVEPIFVEGEPWHGKPTRVFAWWGLPKGASAAAKVPAMVLVHGGGGTAFAQWVKTWNDRGYAAIAMDTCGAIPQGERDGRPHPRHAWSGPSGWGSSVAQIGESLEDQWTYHAVAAVMRCHSFLRSRPEVDRSRTGLTGISWGGYLSTIVGAVDGRFRFAAPVDGCGYYELNPQWHKMSGDKAKLDQLFALWDPCVFLRNPEPVRNRPYLWCCGTNDRWYPLDAVRKTYGHLDGSSPLSLSLKLRMPHGHPPAGDPKEIAAMAEAFLKGGRPFPAVTKAEVKGNLLTVAFASPGRRAERAELLSTCDTNPLLMKRNWTVTPVADFDPSGRLSVRVPPAAVMYFVNVITDDGLVVSTKIF